MSRYQINRCYCDCCKNIPDSQMQVHHLFSNSKLNRKKYGELLEHPNNKILLSEEHHLWGVVPKLSEIDFCLAVDVEPSTKIQSIIDSYYYLKERGECKK